MSIKRTDNTPVSAPRRCNVMPRKQEVPGRKNTGSRTRLPPHVFGSLTCWRVWIDTVNGELDTTTLEESTTPWERRCNWPYVYFHTADYATAEYLVRKAADAVLTSERMNEYLECTPSAKERLLQITRIVVQVLSLSTPENGYEVNGYPVVARSYNSPLYLQLESKHEGHEVKQTALHSLLELAAMDHLAATTEQYYHPTWQGLAELVAKEWLQEQPS